MMPTLVKNCQPPRNTTRIRTRRLLTRIRLRRSAALAAGTPEVSGVLRISRDSLLSTFIANHHLVSKIFPDIMIQLDKTWLEADLLHFPRAWQIDGIETFDRPRPRSNNTHTVG